ncbi:DUF262 domain-containing protein [Achromobacter sp. MY14]|uniref:GmrSD restriction endonuclease domain-containing protein n=1 Tax=unclassified Achromobacter TaxID=2626865 RepID=UPI001E5E3ED9|nr:DUF262 domain-containing protein [Achromobacter sp. MY14]MCD0499376.1 DUF262 domain-containing protein [Achromobacter sp. MY14]
MSANKITPSSPRLGALLSDVSRGNIKIPVFQREYVWKDEQIMSLLDSIYQGYPVGSLLLWSTKVPLKHERDVGGFELPKTPEDFPVNYLLDGQQRLTTLFGVFNSDAKTADPALAECFDVSFVPETEIFLHSSVADPAKSINLRAILDTTKLLPELARFSSEDQKSIATLTERFKDYEFPVVTIRDRSNQEVCRVFQRINSSGTSLSTLELLSAWTWSDQFNLINEIQTLLDRLADCGYEDVGEELVLRCLATIVQGSIDADALVDAPPERLIEGMTKLKQAMYATVDFLEKELRIKNIVFVPFPIMLVPLVGFYARTLKPTASHLMGLKRWFWHCAFTQKYKAGTNTAVLEDLKRMEAFAKDPTVFSALDAKVDPAVFTKTWRINSTIAKAAICLLAQAQPRTFLSGALVDLGTVMSAYNAREFHHIYPKAFLATQGIPFHQSNIIANVCLLTSSDNRSISDKSPATYMTSIPVHQRDNIADGALIPRSMLDGSYTYSDFINARALLLSEQAQSLVKYGTLQLV